MTVVGGVAICALKGQKIIAGGIAPGSVSGAHRPYKGRFQSLTLFRVSVVGQTIPGASPPAIKFIPCGDQDAAPQG